MPKEIAALLNSVQATSELVVQEVYPEHRITFDTRGGEPRNADLAFVGEGPQGRVAVTVEGKADEPFGDTVGGTLSAALERLLETPASQGVQRVSDLVRALFTRREKGQPKVTSLRYQLLTAVAGTLAFARDHDADIAVLIVHEFITDKTRDDAHQQNTGDLSAFLSRLTGSPIDAAEPQLRGPYNVPGAPLFERVPALYIGKATTDCRRLVAD